MRCCFRSFPPFLYLAFFIYFSLLFFIYIYIYIYIYVCIYLSLSRSLSSFVMKVVLDYIGTIRLIWGPHHSTRSYHRKYDEGMKRTHEWAATLQFIATVEEEPALDLCGDKPALVRVQAHHRFVFVFLTSFEHFPLVHFSTTPSQTTK